MNTSVSILDIKSSPRYSKTAKPLKISTLRAVFFRYESSLYLKTIEIVNSCGFQKTRYHESKKIQTRKSH